MTPLDAPDVAGPVIGQRLWRLDARWRHVGRYGHGRQNASFGSLQPMNWPYIPYAWPGRESLDAICHAETPPIQHAVPAPDCRCGVYAFKTIAQVEESLLYLLADDFKAYATRKPYGGRSETWLVAGSVALWGHVIEGTYGYRAEYAYPRMLWLLPPAVFGREDLVSALELLPDLLHALRSRYGVSVGYAGHSHDWNALIIRPSIGQFFAWRFERGGGDAISDALGELGHPSPRPPTVRDAIKLRFPHQQEHWGDQLIATKYLAPALGDVPLYQLRREQLAQYRAKPPRNPRTGKPYSARTARRHLAILREAADTAMARGWFTAADR